MTIKNILFSLLPKKYHTPAWYYAQKLSGHIEKELLELPKWLEPNSVALDIGANIGLYSYILSQYCEKVYSLEPNSNCLRKIIALQKENIQTVQAGVSDEKGELSLYIPLKNKGRLEGLASFRRSENQQCEELKVPVITLDSLNLDKLHFIKIDVEGYELEVLRGGKQTLSKLGPSILIEIEQRHLDFSIRVVFDFLIDLGYQGFFFKNGAYHSLDSFSVKHDQEQYIELVEAEEYDKIRGKYVNNFFFLRDSNYFPQTLISSITPSNP